MPPVSTPGVNSSSFDPTSAWETCALQTMPAARTAARCCRRSPAGCRLARIWTMRKGWPVIMDSVSEVLKFAQPLYDWTVLDLGRLNAASAALLDSVMDVLVVTTVSVPSLYSAKRLVDGLRDTLNQDRTRLVVNHIESSLSMPRSELDSMFGIALYASVPYDREELHAACVQRRLPAKGSRVEKEIASLTRRLTGIPGTKRSLRSMSIS